MNIRLIGESDLVAVQAIEDQVLHTPWNANQIAGELQCSASIGVVAAEEEDVYGYAFFRMMPPEAELLRIGVAVGRQREGRGSALLAEGLRLLVARGITRCFLEVRASNDSAQRLYRRQGFAVSGLRPGYYRDPVEDAILMQIDLTERPGGDCENTSGNGRYR